MKEVQIIYSVGRQFYAIPEIWRSGGIWLSVVRHALPIGAEWRGPGLVFAAIMRGRDYYRIGTAYPQKAGPAEPIESDSEMVRDYADAAWWTPGLQEAWVEAQGLSEAMCQANRQIEELGGQIEELTRPARSRRA